MRGLCVFIFFFNNLINLFAQIDIPYYLDFQDYNFHMDDNIYMDIASPNFPNGAGGGVSSETVISDGLGYSWDLVTKNASLGNSLKLTVHKEDHPHNAFSPASRSEFSIKSKGFKNKSNYYSWKFYIPNDNEYTENEEGWSMMGQLHDGNNKVISISYIDNINLNNNEKRELYILIYDRNENKHSRISVPLAIKKGQWHELILKIKWSEFEKNENQTNYGYLSFWLDRKPPIISSIDENDNVLKYYCYLSNNEDISETKFPFSNLKNGSKSKTYNIKFGHYRSERFETNSMFFDDFNATHIFPNNQTKLKDEYCNIIVPFDYENFVLQGYEIIGAPEYVAKFEYDNIIKFKGLGDNPNINLNDLDFLKSGKTYNISIRAKGVENSDYGEVCSISIPSKTKLKDGYCDIIVPFDYENFILQGYEIIGASEYVAKFEYDDVIKFKGLGNKPNINLSDLDFLKPRKTYNVSIRAKGVENSDYGEACFIYIPFDFSSIKQNNNTNLHSLEENEVFFYPNPVRNFLNIESNLTNITIKIHNNLGQKMIEETLNQSGIIDFSNFSEGIYFITISNTKNHNIKTYKIIKRN